MRKSAGRQSVAQLRARSGSAPTEPGAFLYPRGATLDVVAPAAAVLATGRLLHPPQCPVCAAGTHHADTNTTVPMAVDAACMPLRASPLLAGLGHAPHLEIICNTLTLGGTQGKQGAC